MTLYAAMLWWPVRRFAIAWTVTALVLIIHLLVVFAIPWPYQERASKIIILILVIDVFGITALSDRLEKRTRANRLVGL